MEASTSNLQQQQTPSTAKVACISCRSLKMRCLRTQQQQPLDPCDRCKRVGRDCVVPEYRKPGRVRGAKNKFKGVDRALRQIQTELERLSKGKKNDPGNNKGKGKKRATNTAAEQSAGNNQKSKGKGKATRGSEGEEAEDGDEEEDEEEEEEEEEELLSTLLASAGEAGSALDPDMLRKLLKARRVLDEREVSVEGGEVELDGGEGMGGIELDKDGQEDGQGRRRRLSLPPPPIPMPVPSPLQHHENRTPTNNYQYPQLQPPPPHLELENLDHFFLLNNLDPSLSVPAPSSSSNFVLPSQPTLTFPPHHPQYPLSLSHLLLPPTSNPSPPTKLSSPLSSDHSTPSQPQPPHPSSSTNSKSISNPLGLLAEASEAVRPALLLPSKTKPSSLVQPGGEGGGTETGTGTGTGGGEEGHHTRPVTELLAGSVLDTRLAALALPWDLLAEGLTSITCLPTHPPNVTSRGGQEEEDDVDSFFLPKCWPPKRDLERDWDPIELGLVTKDQVGVFFREFWLQLHPFVSLLDPLIHTPTFVRSRSLFLFTAIMAAGAQFSATATSDVFKRLRHHSERLAKLVIDHECKSLEIAQAFLLWFPWLPPSRTLGEERVFGYILQVMGMASELGLEKRIPGVADKEGGREVVVKALGADLEGMDTNDLELLERMIRNRERFWLRFFTWEAASAVAFGRASVFVENDLIKNEQWHIHRLACVGDKETMAIVRLRRYVISLSADVTYRLQRHPEEGTDWIRPFVDASLDPWLAKWLAVEAVEPDSPLPSIYVELLYRHARLFILSYGLHTPPDQEPPATPPAIVSECLTSALMAVKCAVTSFQSSRFYWRMPNTVYPMLAWAAVLCMRLFDCDVGVEGFIPSQASLLGLLANLAIRLEQVGTTPPHRVGTAAVYGRHLKAVVRARIHSVWKLHEENLDQVVAIKPGTVTPIFGDPGAGVPFASWGTEWWAGTAGTATQLPWSEEVKRMLLELDGGFGPTVMGNGV
ncbi:hypothetical protein T439DRAFT_375753 [Meredithblackwellia eburnea MCA 4105]